MALSLTVVISLFLAIITSSFADDPMVKLKNGLSLTGTQIQFQAYGQDFTVDAYLGIPYVEPPVGPLRFKPPVPKELTGEFTANKHGNVCPQLLVPELEIFPFKEEDLDEDCLTISVFVPQSKVCMHAYLVSYSHYTKVAYELYAT